jgi:hypothetical protein
MAKIVIYNMGLFGPFIYKSKKKNKNFWLHMRIKGKTKLYYFSKDPKDAIGSLPKGFEVFEDPNSGLPFLRKKKSSLLGGLKSKVKKDEKTEDLKGAAKEE